MMEAMGLGGGVGVDVEREERIEVEGEVEREEELGDWVHDKVWSERLLTERLGRWR